MPQFEKTPAFALLTLLAAPPLLAQTFDRDVQALVDKLGPKAIAFRQEIHKNPELGNREVKTAELVAAHLRSLGLEPRTGIAKTGVVAVLAGKKPRPLIAIRADMDALPVIEATDLPFKSVARTTYGGRDVGVSHACGHDVHVAAALGAASVLASMKDRLPGSVMFVFQPAEEGPPPGEDGGADVMLAEGVFKDQKPDAIIAFHTNGDPPDEAGDDELVGRLAYTPGAAYAAATKWTAVVRGRSTHGASPHTGVDPIVTASQVVLALQTIRSRVLPPLSPNVVTVGTFHGGDRNNIIPEAVTMEGTIRSFDDDIHRTIQERMREIFDGITKAAHATFELQFDKTDPVTKNDAALTDRLVPTLVRLFGKDKVRAVPPETGAEDFSFFANVVPGFYFKVGVVPEGKASGGHHTPTFYADDRSVPIAMRALSTLALDYLAPAPAR